MGAMHTFAGSPYDSPGEEVLVTVSTLLTTLSRHSDATRLLLTNEGVGAQTVSAMDFLLVVSCLPFQPV